jgi:hypothetical protein
MRGDMSEPWAEPKLKAPNQLLELRRKSETALRLAMAIGNIASLARERGHHSVASMLDMARDLARADHSAAEQALSAVHYMEAHATDDLLARTDS